MVKNLNDTIELMNSEDYKDRFKAEYYQLKIRSDKLQQILVKYKKNELSFKPKCSYELLHDQFIRMHGYMCALEKRAEIENIEI